MNDPAEYWVRGVLAYFDAAGQHQAPLDTSHPTATREALERYDPGLFGIVEETMAYKGKTDWRLPLARQAHGAIRPRRWKRHIGSNISSPDGVRDSIT